MRSIAKADLDNAPQLPGPIPRARTEGLIEIEGRYYPAARPVRRSIFARLRSRLQRR